ncbi:MAG: hypothetical protein ROR55_01880 [Devosia sp.]
MQGIFAIICRLALFGLLSVVGVAAASAAGAPADRQVAIYAVADVGENRASMRHCVSAPCADMAAVPAGCPSVSACPVASLTEAAAAIVPGVHKAVLTHTGTTAPPGYAAGIETPPPRL